MQHWKVRKWKINVNFFLYHHQNFPILLCDNLALGCAVRFNRELKPPGSWKHAHLQKNCCAEQVTSPSLEAPFFPKLQHGCDRRKGEKRRKSNSVKQRKTSTTSYSFGTPAPSLCPCPLHTRYRARHLSDFHQQNPLYCLRTPGAMWTEGQSVSQL